MPAFTYTRFEQVKGGLRMMYHRSIAYKRCFLTFKQLKKLFLDPEHYELLEKATELFRVHGDSEFEFTLPGSSGVSFKANAYSGGEDAFPFPNYMGKEFFAGEDDLIFKELKEWVDWRVRLAHDFTVAFAVLDEFQKSCPSPRIVSYLWPSLVPIMRMCKDDSLRKLANKLSESRTVPGDVPGFSSAFKACANESAGVVARTQMLNNEHDQFTAKKGKAYIELQAFTMKCPWSPDNELYHYAPMQPEL